MTEDKNHNDIVEIFKQTSQKARLTLREKEAIKNNIIRSPYIFGSQFWTYQRLVGSIAVIALLISGGGASFAAAYSLPGEALYGVKVNVNEEVQSFIAITPDAKAKVEVDRATERLNEAEQLSVQGKLNTNTQAIIKQNLRKHTDTIKQNVALLASEQKSSEANDVINDFKATLDEHEATLKSISDTSSDANIVTDDTATSSEDTHTDVAASSSLKVKKMQSIVAASTTSVADQSLGDIISSVAEVKAEIQIVQDNLDTNKDAAATSSTATTTQEKSTFPKNTTATTTASSTASISASTSSSTKATASSSTTIKLPIKQINKTI